MTPPGISDIQRNAAKPLYHQLIERLKTMIAGMTERGETLLPSERDLCRLFAVSHTTVRLALKELEVSGLLLNARVFGFAAFFKFRLALLIFRLFRHPRSRISCSSGNQFLKYTIIFRCFNHISRE